LPGGGYGAKSGIAGMLITLLHNYSEIISPYLISAYAIIAAGFLTLIIGFITRGLAFFRYTPGVLYVLSSAALFSPRIPQHYWPLVFRLFGAALLCHFILQRKNREEVVGIRHGSPRASLVYLGAVLASLAVFLFYRLEDFSGVMVGWDTWVSRDFSVAYLKGQGIGSHAFDCLLWGNNAMTGSHLSLLYGAPTYALLHIIGFSVWTLRFPSVIYSLLSVVMFYVIGRRFFCPLIGGLAAVLLAWNSNLLSYARYGCSPAATLFSILIAIYFAWLFLESDKPSWWMGPVCGLTLCLATLQYAPGRIGVLIILGFILVVVIRPWWLGLALGVSICLAANRYAPARTAVFILLGLILVSAVWQWRRIHWRRLLGVALILLVVFGFYHFQVRYHRTGYFLYGGGEQYFKMRAGNKTLYEDFNFIRSMTRTTFSEYLWLLSPHTSVTPEMVLAEPSRNPLYYAPLLPFIVWGFIYSLLRVRRSWRHGFLLAWFVLFTPPLLLCNQVNPHRSQLLIISLLLWAAFGVQEACRLMRQARVPQIMQHILAVILILMMIYASATIFFFRVIPRNSDYQAIAEEVATISGPLVVGAKLQMPGSYASLINLELLERTRLDPEGRHSALLEHIDGRIETGRHQRGPVFDAYLDSLGKILKTATLILAPADRFIAIGGALRGRGHKMVFRQRGDCSFLLFPHGEFVEVAPEDREVSEDMDGPVDAEATVGAIKAATQPASISP
jgi:4-amino-4-deoxy-L-arabinose transferase-like glycosyltransferase